MAEHTGNSSNDGPHSVGSHCSGLCLLGLLTKYQGLGDFHNTGLFPHTSGGWKLGSGLVPSASVRENRFHASRLASGGLLAIFRVPGSGEAPPRSVSMFTRRSACPVSVSKFPLFIWTPLT